MTRLRIALALITLLLAARRPVVASADAMGERRGFDLRR